MYIMQRGIGWTSILQHDQRSAKIFNSVRTGGNLKDKARNLKYHIMAANIELPPNFDKIALGQVLEKRLARFK